MIVNFCTKTDIGNKRSANQDFCGYHVADKYDIAFFLVADGMGGHNAGEIASSIAAITFIDASKEFFDIENISGIERFIKHTVKKANILICRRAYDNPALKGMGTTFVAAAVTNDFFVVANVGDSRAYLIDDKQIKQITKDHSYVQYLVEHGLINEVQAQSHPRKNEITRALGASEDVEVDFFTGTYEKGNYLLLCSDGLTNMVLNEEIYKSVAGCSDVYTACEELIQKANDAGGTDNISVALIKL